jgi:Tfp pilus assembly PilM family ATPase
MIKSLIGLSLSCKLLSDAQIHENINTLKMEHNFRLRSWKNKYTHEDINEYQNIIKAINTNINKKQYSPILNAVAQNHAIGVKIYYNTNYEQLSQRWFVEELKEHYKLFNFKWCNDVEGNPKQKTAWILMSYKSDMEQ